MKNILIFTALLICTANICNGQYFNAGLRLGANFCQIDGDNMSGFNQAGLVGGVFASYKFNKNWEGQFEMLYSQKGSARVTTDTSANNINGDWDQLIIDYIEVPVMINYIVNKKIKLSGGLGGALMIGNHYVGRNNNVIQDNINGLTKGELSGTVGAQYFFSPRFSVYGRFTYSLIGINKPNPGVSASTNAAAFYLYDGGLANDVISFGLYFYMLNPVK